MRKGETASHNIFHSYTSLMRQNAVLCGNWLTRAVTECDLIPPPAL